MRLENVPMPRLGFGMMRLPEKDGEIDIPRVCSMVDAYMAREGAHYFDTAYVYHSGKSEAAIKEALVKRYPRESFYLATKLPVWAVKEPADRDRIFSEQLRRTGVDYFDFYLLHSVEAGHYENYEKYDCFHWALEKKAQGKIKHFGFSFHGTPELLEQVLEKYPEVEFVQIQLNYADWNYPVVQSGRLYEILHTRGIPVIVMEPVKGGALASMAPELESMLKAARPDASIASWAMRFVGSLDGVTTILSGMSSEEQMNDNLNTFAKFEPLSPEESKIIDAVVKKMLDMPLVPCTSCRYCCDGCPKGIHIPDVFRALNSARMYPDASRPHYFYKSLTAGSGKAKDCLACGQCEHVCPQHLPIIELLREASQKLDRE